MAQASALVRQAIVLYPLGHLHSPLSRALHLWHSQNVKVREEGAAPLLLTSCFSPGKCQSGWVCSKPEPMLALYTQHFFSAVYRKTCPVAHGPSPSHNHSHNLHSPWTKEQMFGLWWSSKAASSQQFFSRCLSPAVTEASALRVNIPTLRQALRCIRHKCLLSH